ncbi:hypothetical protein GR160_17445 [Flavobacterium sp. Sd200]|uniref:hypothetical protein n=1 Tax=Flavobacterium sp. Sd200 TaxID=2692211 RepID=UPI001371692B|nr:hypothetical protein [Flavobacterium sp. Sd200]MXN93014.1 hypothetical protein [Flavobacterium sp. Sd200]
MILNQLTGRPEIEPNTKLHNIYIQFGLVLSELQKKQLTEDIVKIINDEVDALNALPTNESLAKVIKLKQTAILKVLEKQLKIVPKNYYRNIWLALGMSVFGLPIGIAFGTSVGNMGLLGIGLPIGMFIGILIGTTMDKKALQEGRQLELDIKH